MTLLCEDEDCRFESRNADDFLFDMDESETFCKEHGEGRGITTKMPDWLLEAYGMAKAKAGGGA